MRYEEVYLTLETDEARRRIGDQVSNVRTKATDDRIEYRTNTGILLAVLSGADLPSGEKGSKLRYRTAIISSPLGHARTQARAIRRAVENDISDQARREK